MIIMMMTIMMMIIMMMIIMIVGGGAGRRRGGGEPALLQDGTTQDASPTEAGYGTGGTRTAEKDTVVQVFNLCMIGDANL